MFYECLSRKRPLGAVGSVPKHGTELLEIIFSHGAAITGGRGCLDKLSVDLWIKWCFGMHWAGNGRGLRVYKVNR